MSASGSVKAGKAFVEILLEQSKLERGLKQAQAKLRNFGASVTGAGKTMLATAAAVFRRLAATLSSLFDHQPERIPHAEHCSLRQRGEHVLALCATMPTQESIAAPVL